MFKFIGFGLFFTRLRGRSVQIPFFNLEISEYESVAKVILFSHTSILVVYFTKTFWKEFLKRPELVYWNERVNTDRQCIKNSIQWGVGQLSTTNYPRVMEDFLESVVLFFGKNKYTNIKFWTIFHLKARFIASKKYRKK